MALFRRWRDLRRPYNVFVYSGDDAGVAVANMDAAQLYRTQPNLRAVVSFLADNAAQVPIKVHERASDTDRPRVTDSPAALLLADPNPDMTAFEFKRCLYSDLLLYERFMCLIMESDTPSGYELRPVPTTWMQGYKGGSVFAPESVIVGVPGNAPVEVPSENFVLWHGYDPTDPMRQCSRISALKETLHEQVESNSFRRQMWRRGGRFNMYLTRPKDVQAWSPEAFERFKETWKASWAGSDAGEGGGTPILEDGMEIRNVQFNSRDAQWAEAVKLSREDCAAVYHVNPAMIWPGSGQTYASARDNARALYNDCLASTLMQACDRINKVILPRVGEPPSHYAAYDLKIKTEGTFEERIATLSSAVGAPFLSRNEARAELNLPAIEGGDDLITPLNVLVGGLASPRDSDPTRERYNSTAEAIEAARDILGLKAAPGAPRKASGKPNDDDADEIASAYRAFFKRQAKSVLAKLGAKSEEWWDGERWDRELAEDLYKAVMGVSARTARAAVADLWGDGGAYDVDRTRNYIKSMCQRRAEMANQVTRAELVDAIEGGFADGDDSDALKATPEGVFENAEENRSVSAGAAFACAVVGWSLLEAARQNQRRGENVFKTWVVTSGNPRASHAALDGETVQYDEPFSNGAMWPGDCDALDVSEVANCQCVLDIEVRD